ncbi:MAG: site-specific DNA-methyltransferase [Candidatus Brocadiaceae bacterium]|nr:site-specific DNA-methyltransferase [Candidatus Brocadiaceae bacterium]
MPEAFTEGKIDWEKLKAALGEDVEFKNERYVLNWAGKSDAFRVLQSPTTATLAPHKEESVSFDSTENIFIEGENLEVLKVLQKSYFGRIKMIYIDPPYNTGNDTFIYPDKFSETKEEYLNRIGDKDETGFMTREGLFRKNSKDSGHYHSNWLSMIYPRLFLARNLLRDDGVIFVSIDDNEVHNLRLLMNEVFGEENFLGQVVWKNATDNNPTRVATEHEYVCIFAKNKEKCEAEWKSSISDVKDKLIEIGEKLISENKDLQSLRTAYDNWFKTNKVFLGPLDRYKYIDDDGIYTGSQSVHNPGKEGYRYDVKHPATKKPCKQPLMGYRFPEDTMKELLNEGKILFGQDESKIIELKVYAKDYQEKLASVIELDGRLGAYDLKNVFPQSTRVFNNPKPIRFINSLFSFVLKDNDISLDFFSGSCPTAQAVLDLNKQDGGNRKFICIQLPEKCEEKSEAFKAGYKTIADIGKERIQQVIKKIKKEQDGKLDLDGKIGKQDLGFKVFKLQQSNFKIWRSKIEGEEQLVKQLQKHLEPLDEHAKTENVLYELLLKSGNPLTSKIDKKDGCFLANNDELALILENINEKIIKNVITTKPKKVITLDRLFNGDDQLKTNTALQMKDAGIDFRVV